MGIQTALSGLFIYIGSLPLLLVWLIGGGLALQHWRRRPRVCLLCFISMAIMLVWFVLEHLLQMLLPTLMESMVDNLWAYAALGVLGNLVSACSFGLLLWALFGHHGQPNEDR